jgi:hypothetical protein
MQSNVRSRPRPGVFAAPEQRWFQWARRDPGPMRLCRDPLGRRDCRRTSAPFRHVMPTIYDPRHYLPVPTCHPGLRVRIRLPPARSLRTIGTARERPGMAALSLVSIDVGKLVVSSIIVKGPPGPLLTRFFLRPDYHVQNYRDAAGGSRAAIVLPEEVRGPIADPVLDRLRRAGSSRPPHSPGRVSGPSGRRAAHTGRFWK